MATKHKATIKATAVEEAAVQPEGNAPEARVMSFEDFLQISNENAGLVASFRWEASKIADGLKPRTKDEWIKALEDQSKRVY